MDRDRLSAILEKFTDQKILVFGDFFLDEYLMIDKSLSEVSLETGLEAHQVVNVRALPGAAGVVTNNLSALDTNVIALGVMGKDGRGYELKKGLVETNVDISPMLQSADLITPTYIKPIMKEPDGSEHELERMDIKNRFPLPPALEEALIERIKGIIPQVNGVIIVDHVPERNYGVITDRLRDVIALLAASFPEKYFLADSRRQMALFNNIIIKCNVFEARSAAGIDRLDGSEIETGLASADILYERNSKPVIVTMGDLGIVVRSADYREIIPAMPVSEPIDIVGAGDSTISAITAALCAGANLREAALIGNLVASITIQQLGTTGVASRNQVKERFVEYQEVVGN
jgi:rfaE bifunctional protein kinase chain/domain